jgi:23S rRNA (cytosine1962-C5)-methyltransferase
LNLVSIALNFTEIILCNWGLCGNYEANRPAVKKLTKLHFLQNYTNSPLKLKLARNLTRAIKQGHPWVFAEALRELPPAPPGSPAILLDNKKGRVIGRGFYDPHSSLALRICTVEAEQTLHDDWARSRFEQALALRRTWFDDRTTGFRLFNGEGDGLPGLICDLYGEVAVMQFDGAGAAGFWNPGGIAAWLVQTLPIRWVYRRSQARLAASEELLRGDSPMPWPVPFLENGVRFTADVSRGQKTGFFLDQRDNRQRIKAVAAGRRVLNLFGYTGGFSVYAGLGGASQVTTVDLAEPALAVAHTHWCLNGLEPANHKIAKADAFHFLEQAGQARQRWELVVLDPPSFAASKEAVPQAVAAYQRLISGAAAVTTRSGLLAAASCSSHIDPETFLQLCTGGISQARRQATVLGIYGQPADHPWPLACPELRYLKFVLLRLE